MADTNPTNEEVLKFAVDHIGTSVDKDGNTVASAECWDLPEAALASAGAKTSREIMGHVTKTGTYRWGTRVNPEDALQGDVVQMENYKAIWSETSKYCLPDTSWFTIEKPSTYRSRDYHHHSAIITSSPDMFGVVSILEQYANAAIHYEEILTRSLTQDSDTHLDIDELDKVIPIGDNRREKETFDKIRETVRKCKENTKNRIVLVHSTTKITITGSIVIYRPTLKPRK